MTIFKNPQNMFILLFIALLLSFIFIICKHCRWDAAYQQNIDDHSEIVDTI